ncbi:Lon protease like, mitochondrial [Schistosoma japonicum]|nr:Lon protease like, mitochondrial [Schistosoma japonicum]
MIEITDERLINLIRRKIMLNAPYAGIFLKKSNTDHSDVANSMNELHRVGTFVHIPEWDDLGSKIRLLVIGHRRLVCLSNAFSFIFPFMYCNGSLIVIVVFVQLF